MREHGLEVEKALDRVVFGTNDPKGIDKKLNQMEQYLELENSSLGHSLAGIRHRHYWSLETGAEKAGVPLEVLRDWEADTRTPDPEELKAVLKRLRWSWDLDRFMALREKAGRVQLLRLSRLCPALLAASGKSGVSGAFEWRSLDDVLKERLTRWGEKRGLVFPEALLEVLAGFDNDEERESWIDEVLRDARV
jgi:hypothetical protein